MRLIVQPTSTFGLSGFEKNLSAITLSAVGLLAFVLSPSNLQSQEFELKDGDRVVFLGSEFVEQQVKHNFLEAALTLNWADRNIEFRNLGWAGDTPTGIARGYFGGAKEGFARLKDELDRISPTVVFVCYGANLKPEEFSASFKTLLSELKSRTKRIVVVSHPPAELKGTRFANVEQTNKSRRLASDALRKIVENERIATIRFVDLFLQVSNEWNSDVSGTGGMKEPATFDTIRLNANGYLQCARVLTNRLGFEMPTAKTFEQVEKEIEFNQLRSLLYEKNQLFFHRYRPQNETYLRGFRKHEQGQNAKEIEQFDALIEQAEARIRAFVQGKPLPDAVEEPEPIQLSFEAASIEEEKESFKLAEGMEVSLFASEPMIANPIHMNFDSKGRLWVATSPIYPHIKPGAKPQDQIVVLEDTDGDGQADKKTVFANDLLIPTAVLPDERGGAYVANSTEMLHLQDTDGDGVADKRRVVLSGFGTEDTHHIIHTFRWAPDAAIYFNQSIYIHTHIETPTGVKRLMGSGIWRFEPNKVDANVLMRGLVNPWGHIFDAWGQSFATDGAGGDGINYAFPGSAYPTAVGFSKVLRGMNPGQPKLCGLEIITGGHFPEPWRETLVTNDFRGNRINRFQLTPEGSGYASKQLPDLLTSSHRAFRPVDVKMAPDGSLFVADWYNPIINHGEVDFRDSRRDYKHGRIWRVTAKDRPLLPMIDFENASVIELVRLLTANEQWVGVKARIELMNRSMDIRESRAMEIANDHLVEMLGSRDTREQVAAMWTIEALKKTTPQLLSGLLKSTDHRVRAAALRVLANQRNPTDRHRSLARPLAEDDHPQVRLEYVNAWRSLFSPSEVEGLVPLFGETDKYIDFAVTNAMKETCSSWIGDLAERPFAQDPEKLLYVLKKVEAPETVQPMLDLLSGGLEKGQSNELIQLVSKRGNPQQLKTLFKLGVANKAIQAPVLNALVSWGERRRPTVPLDEATSADLERLFDKGSGLQLAGLWKAEPLREKVKNVAVGKTESSIPQRAGAIRGLAAYGDFKTLKAIVNSDAPIHIKSVTISQIASARVGIAASLAPKFFAETVKRKQSEKALQLVEVFLRRRDGAKRLIEVLKKNPLPDALVTPITERARKFGRDGNLLAKAIQNGGSGKLKKKLTKNDVKEIVEIVKQSGDAHRGETIYRRDELNCLKCHAIGGSGGVVGPDMISLGASSPVDYIVQSLVDPNAKIKEGYHTTTVLTIDGVQVSGKLMSQADGQVVLRDIDNKEVVILEDDIEEQKTSTSSLMPADLTEKLSKKEFVDLVAFLSSLGKEGDFKVPAKEYVRRWEMQDDSVRISCVDGWLPAEDIKTKFVSFEFDVVKAGTIGFRVENYEGLRITLDDMKDNLRAEKIVKDLSAGKHRIEIRVGGKAATDGLRVEMFEVERSTARAVLAK